MREACGVFGINFRRSCFGEVKAGAFNIQHRGQEWGGFSLFVRGQIENVVEPGLIKSTFEEAKRKRPELLEGQMGIAHVSLLDPQPVKIESSRVGPFALALNGRIVNRDKCLESLGDPPLQIGSDAEILAMMIARGKDYVDGIKEVLQNAKGAFSLVVLTPDGVFAARDPLGFKPLALGKGLDGCACSSESPGLTKINMQLIREVKAGEIVLLEPSGFTIQTQIGSPRRALCPFEYSYFARVSSIIEGIPVVIARHNMGAALFQNDDVDLVSPIPFSGIAHAEGYHLVAIAAGAPYVTVFEYNRYSDRSWTSPSQDTSDETAEEKLTIIEGAIKGKRIALADDSIFGATQIKGWIFRLIDMGARQVHCRISAPPVKHPCLVDFPNRIGKKLIAVDHNEEEIRRMIGATTLRFNTLDVFLNAIISAQIQAKKEKDLLLPEDFCTYCFTGINPLGRI